MMNADGERAVRDESMSQRKLGWCLALEGQSPKSPLESTRMR
jgi:hypothetical protein